MLLGKAQAAKSRSEVCQLGLRVELAPKKEQRAPIQQGATAELGAQPRVPRAGQHLALQLQQ